jgi:hypothetical protein
MDNLQDIGYNRIHVIDDTEADKDRSGCAVFEGGINVEKNILVKSICCNNIELDTLKVYNNIIIQNNIKIGGDIIPIYDMNKCKLGNKDNKIQKIFCIEGLYNTIKTNTINVNNLNVNILRPSSKICIINENKNINIKLEYIYIFIIIENIEYTKLHLIFEKPKCKNEYHKIIIKNNNCKIKLNLNSITCHDEIQIYEIISFNGNDWFIIPNHNIKYNNKYLLLEYKPNKHINACNLNHIIIPSFESNPDNIEGSIYLNSITKKLKICINGIWNNIKLEYDF